MANVKEKARRTWVLEDARQRFGELIEKARSQGPQHVMINGKEAVVVISEEDFKRLEENTRTGHVLVEVLANSPLKEVDFDLPSVKAPVRDVDL